MFTGISVPSLETAISRATSTPEVSTGDSSASAVFSERSDAGSKRYQADGTT